MPKFSKIVAAAMAAEGAQALSMTSPMEEVEFIITSAAETSKADKHLRSAGKPKKGVSFFAQSKSDQQEEDDGVRPTKMEKALEKALAKALEKYDYLENKKTEMQNKVNEAKAEVESELNSFKLWLEGSKMHHGVRV